MQVWIFFILFSESGNTKCRHRDTPFRSDRFTFAPFFSAIRIEKDFLSFSFFSGAFRAVL